MKIMFTPIAAAFVLTLGACGGSGDDSLGDNAADAAEAQSENLEAQADNASGAQEEALRDRAETVEEAGEEREEAIDDSDVDASRLSADQRNALTNGQ
ncbi:MAG: hypothetical protein M3448_00495 [Pseudomonadota bacterium]|nr:hypothetical protein [Pseudomonadota bacterium]